MVRDGLARGSGISLGRGENSLRRVKRCGRGRDPLGFARGRLFDFVAAPLSRSGHYAQDDNPNKAVRLELPVSHGWLLDLLAAFEGFVTLVDFVPVDYVPPGG